VRLGLAAVHTPHGWSIGERISTASGRIITLAERVAARWARAVICVCEYERRLAIEKRVAAPEDLFVVHNGVHDIGPELRAVADAQPVRVCSIARLDAPKDHVTLLEACARIEAGEWTLELVGDGPLEGELRARAGALGIAGKVRFLGYKNDPAGVLGGAQMFALSSRSEAFPRSVLEAMRAGLPVVASDVGGVREAVAHGETGLLVPPGDAEALRAAIARLAGDASLRRVFGDAARRVYEQRFRLECMVAKTEAVYHAALGRAAAARLARRP
jgi:glycosyltransferase involved in cell wall biosynthesis